GVPKNFIQQTAVIASYQTRHDRTHDFAIQFTTDVPQWGGLSGSTFEEAQSWGKYNARSRMVQCFTDATIALPVVAEALSQRFKRLNAACLDSIGQTIITRWISRTNPLSYRVMFEIQPYLYEIPNPPLGFFHPTL